MWGRFLIAIIVTLPPALARVLEDYAGDEADVAAAAEFFEELLDHPRSVNSLTVNDFERMLVFSPFAIASIMDYRREYGDILSAAELSLVDGLGEQNVEMLLPFITFDRGVPVDTLKLRPKAKIVGRTVTKLVRSKKEDGPAFVFQNADKGSPVAWVGSARLSFGSRAGFGISSRGEQGSTEQPLRVGAYAYFNDVPLGRKHRITTLAVGDFNVRLGQGIAAWSGFTMNNFSLPSSVLKSGRGVASYTGTTGDGVMRGLGATFRFGRSMDASIALSPFGEEGASLAGGVQYSFGKWRLGASFGTMDSCGAVAVNAVASIGAWAPFAEVGVDFKGRPAAVAGMLVRLPRSAEFGLLLRYYDKDFDNPLAGAFSTGSKVSNELGLTSLISSELGRGFSIKGCVDGAWHPGPTYRCDGPSGSVKARTEGLWEKGGHSVLLRGEFQWKSTESWRRYATRAVYSLRLPIGLNLITRLDFTAAKGFGGAAGQGFSYSHKSGIVSASLYATFVHADDWSCRIYVYEGDLPGSYSVPALYGRGVETYVLLTVKTPWGLRVDLKSGASLRQDRSKDNFRIRLQLTWTI
ncbi:MAG: hypothetical protein HUJ89_06445 [Bacteroidales bacterium]|nr:hypothetical protein [Bacteroidales bacterium]